MEYENYNATLERIISGEDVVNHIPWQVSIQAYKARLNIWENICGGTILNQYTILSAAHCFYTSYKRLGIKGDRTKRYNPGTLRIVAGSPFVLNNQNPARFPNVQVQTSIFIKTLLRL